MVVPAEEDFPAFKIMASVDVDVVKMLSVRLISPVSVSMVISSVAFIEPRVKVSAFNKSIVPELVVILSIVPNDILVM